MIWKVHENKRNLKKDNLCSWKYKIAQIGHVRGERRGLNYIKTNFCDRAAIEPSSWNWRNWTKKLKQSNNWGGHTMENWIKKIMWVSEANEW